MSDVEQKIVAPGDGTQHMEARFRRLANDWRERSEFLSSAAESAMLPEYQSIIGMGPAVLPLILGELKEHGGHWFWALRAITGEDPTAPENRGDIQKMRGAWLDWAVRQGHLAP
jgi:hypothetical protein